MATASRCSAAADVALTTSLRTSRSAKRAARAASSELTLAPLGDLVRRYLYDHLPLGDLVAFLHQDVSNGHVVFGGDNGWLSKDQTLSTQIDVCAQDNIEHPDTESDKRQEVGPFDRHALHD